MKAIDVIKNRKSGKTASASFHFFPLALLLFGLLAGCKQGGPQRQDAAPSVNVDQVAIPAFSADSALSFVASQVAFGNRIPGSQPWKECAAWIEGRMRQWCDTVMVQPFSSPLWDGSVAPGRNIIASLNPQAAKRVLLAAHWDSRRWADHDPDEANHKSPVPGANDGASGVGLLMEMARVMCKMRPSVGVDFVFFDVEDQGQPEWAEKYEENSWCKGSQYWGHNLHVPYYSAVYGILFDMVGTKNPRFTKEQVSRTYAPGLTDKLWNMASVLGYGQVFVAQNTDPILDDHLYVNQLAGIPMVDIVQNNGTTSFFEHWHTVHDDLDAVDPRTLQLVATVVMKTIYADFPAKQ